MSYSEIIKNDITRVSKGLFMLLGYGIFKAYQYIGTFCFFFLMIAYYTYKSRNPYAHTVNAENLAMIWWTVPAILMWLITPLKLWKESLDKRYIEE